MQNKAKKQFAHSLEDTELARIPVKGLIAPEATLVPQSKEKVEESVVVMENSEQREVLTHMARLDFELDLESGATLVSIYQAYQAYLNENNLMDPAEALNNAAVKKGPLDAQKQKALAEGDGSDLEGLDEPSYNENGANRFKFENVIKSMVARLELQNGLAPV